MSWPGVRHWRTWLARMRCAPTSTVMIQSSFAWSLTVFEGSFSLEASEAVCEQFESAVERGEVAGVDHGDPVRLGVDDDQEEGDEAVEDLGVAFATGLRSFFAGSPPKAI